MSGGAGIDVVRDGATVRLVLDAPPVNVIGIAMLDALERGLREADADDAVRLIRIEARGRTFSAGVDVADHVGDKVATMMESLERLFVAFEEIDTVTVAAVDGAAIGGGCEVALGADLAYASDRAKFGQPEIKLGLLAPPASVLLPRRIGEARALDLLLTGRTIDGAEAAALGLVARCFPADRFAAEVDAVCAGLLELSATALAHARRAVRLARGGDVAEAHRRVNRYYGESLMRTADAHEGLDAFLARRPPRWKHR